MKRETKEKLIAFAKTLDDLLEREEALTYLQKAPEDGKDGEKASPVYAVKAIPVEDISANTYNPNHVAPPEMKLLYDSIKEDGYTIQYEPKEPDGPGEVRAVTFEGIVVEVNYGY